VTGQHRANGTDYEAGCRCDTCRAANTERVVRRQHERRAARQLINGRLVAPVPPHRHGLASTYVNWSCRCEPCTQAGAKRNAADRARRAATQNRRPSPP
jgi:hypothetical protein